MADSTAVHDDTRTKPQQSVRFGSTSEISPTNTSDTIHPANEKGMEENLTEEQRKELREMSVSLQQSRLQSARMDQFVFDPVSLPASRVPSAGSSTQVPVSGGLTPGSSPTSRHTSQHLLTPAHSGNNESATSGKGISDTLPVTPQDSPSMDTGASRGPSRDTKPSAGAEARAKAVQGSSQTMPAHPKQPPAHLDLPKAESNPSYDESPSGTPGEAPSSGAQSPYSRPFTPQGDPNHPYSRSKRPPQNRDLDNVEPRFVFGGGKPDRGRNSLFSCPPSRSPVTEHKPEEKVNRSSIFGSSRRDSDDDNRKSHNKDKSHHHHGSMSDLKRFFKFGGSKKEKRDKSPAPSQKPSKSSGISTPPTRSSLSVAAPFADDHGLEAKYGKFEKILGSGAGGSVRLMKRGDGTTFAVKQFRERHSWETAKAYNKKITAEFCIGSTLHHGNIIEAMDIVSEKGRWYEVMEYAPFDLFAIVMTGKMSREEVACCYMQILNGMAYLHSMGLAHRDMKLDNVVVNEHGIMKIIDFGSAHVFQYPFEGGIVMAEGVVGSDPYLAPEVFTQKTYDARAVDIWSLAIIFCCMSLRRFPWKCPKTTDNSFKLFITQPTEEELSHPLYPQRQPPKSESTTPSHTSSGNTDYETLSQQQRPSQPSIAETENKDNQSTASVTTATIASSTTSVPAPSQNITLKGPWRLLRLLPRETRHIIGRMLELDPTKRATLEEITADPWVTKSPFCRQEVTGQVIFAAGHTHILEGGAGGS